MCIKKICINLAMVAGLLIFSHISHAMEPSIRMSVGEQKSLHFAQALARVATSDPKVLDVAVSDKNELLLTAVADGSSTLMVWLKGNALPMQSRVLVASTLGEQVPFNTQVQTDIRIVEVSRTQLNSLGLYYSRLFNGGTSSAAIAPPGSAFRGSQLPSTPAAPISLEGFNLFSLGANSLAIVSALESGGFAYTLAEPSLTSISGQNATFLSGGEFPIPVKSDNNGVQIKFKQFGVSLSLTPTVINEQQLMLTVAPEVSELDFSSGVVSGGVAVPGLRVRRAETTVSMAPGESFIIGGLVSQNTINNSDRVPGLGNLPVLGVLFRSTKIAREDKELIMIVTPHIVQAGQLDPGATMPGAEYAHTSMRWVDMAGETGSGTRPIRYGFSW